MVRKIVTLALMAGTLAIAACNTVEGLGKDVESAGEEGEAGGDRAGAAAYNDDSLSGSPLLCGHCADRER